MAPKRHYHIYHGDCLERLRQIPFGNCVDLIVTDPPYGMNFMGAALDWDKAVPPVEVWKVCLRVLKPGGFAFIQCIPRQDCLGKMISNLQEAGFETNFTSLYWTFATGFPKASNLSKEADKKADKDRRVTGITCAPNSKKEGYKGKRYKEKRKTKFGVVQDQPEQTEAATKEAFYLNGAFGGFQPKPATEVILVVMKPIEKVTREQLYKATGWDYWYTSVRELKTKKQVETLRKKYGKKKVIKIGKTVKRKLALNPELQDKVVCGKKVLERTPYKNTTFKTFLTQALVNGKGCTWLGDCRIPIVSKKDAKEVGGKNQHTKFGSGPRTHNVYGDLAQNARSNYNPTTGRFPANLLVSDDAFSGHGFNRGDWTRGSNSKAPTGYDGGGKPWKVDYGDKSDKGGSYSRYFDLDAWFLKFVDSLPDKVQKTFPYLIVPKPSKKEKNSRFGGSQYYVLKKGFNTEFKKGLKEALGSKKYRKITKKKYRKLPQHLRIWFEEDKNHGLGNLPEKISDPIARHRGRRMKKPSRIDGKPPSKMQNHHPTVKPITLMSYLITLGSRPGDIVLDPYCGSGTTGVAARLLDRTFIGMELDKDYARIAKRRIGKPTKLFVKKNSQ